MSGLYIIRNAGETALLQLLAENGPMSRADLARAMGVMRSTVGNMVNRLIENDVLCVLDVPQDPGGERPVGRPGALVALNGGHCHFIGAQIGVGHVRVLCADLAGRIVSAKEERIEVSTQTPEAMAERLDTLVAACAGARRIAGGVAVAVPGVVDRHGVVLRAPNLGWRNVRFRDLLAGRLGHWGPVSLENDANAFVLAELVGHAERARDTAVFLWIDAGIGGGIAANGALLRGYNGLAGEIGHIFVGPDTGHERLEDLAGREALLRRTRALGGKATDLPGFFEELDAGAAGAAQAADEWVDVIARALASLNSVLNPRFIVFGGPMTAVLTRLRPALDRAFADVLLPGTMTPEMVISSAGRDAVALGGIYRKRAEFFEGRTGAGAEAHQTAG